MNLRALQLLVIFELVLFVGIGVYFSLPRVQAQSSAQSGAVNLDTPHAQAAANATLCGPQASPGAKIGDCCSSAHFSKCREGSKA